MQIKITGIDLPQYQQQPGTIGIGDYKPLTLPKPKIYGTPLAGVPIGYDQEGKPVFPKGEQIPPWGVEFGKHKGTISPVKPFIPSPNITSTDVIPVLRQEELDKRLAELDKEDKKAWDYSRKLRNQEEAKKSVSGTTKAVLALTGLRGISNILSREQDRARREQYRIESGRTDSYFPTVPNIYSRGTEEINTGEFMPNLRTPVQFPGIPAAEFYGMRQYQGGGGVDAITSIPGTGALLPSMPATFIDITSVEVPGSFAPSEANATPSVSSSPELETTMVSRGFALPAAPYVFRLSSGFGPRKSPKPGASSNHNGNDMGMPINTPLFSVKEGIVKNVYEDNK